MPKMNGKYKEKADKDRETCTDFMQGQGFCWVGDKRGFFARKGIGVYHRKQFREMNKMIRNVFADEIGGDSILGHEAPVTLTDLEHIRQNVADMCAHDMNEFEDHPEIISFKNGYLNTETWEFDDEFGADVKTFIQIPHNYIQTEYATPAKFEEFLDMIVCESKAPQTMKQQIYEMIGYSLTRSVGMQKAFILTSKEGATGKSTLCNIIAHICGIENVAEMDLAAIANSRFGLSGLVGKSVNICAELSNKAVKDAGVIKKLITEAWLTYEQKFGDTNLKQRNIICLIFSCNKLPYVKDIDNPFARRWVIIDFSYVIPLEDRVKQWEITNIIENEGEMENIIWKSIEALKELYSRGHFEGGLPGETLDRWKMETDSVYKFVKVCCSEGVDHEMKQSELFHKFTDFAQFNGDAFEVPQRIFTQRLKSMGFRVKQGFEVFNGKRIHIKVYSGVEFAKFPAEMKVANYEIEEKLPEREFLELFGK